MRTAGGQTAFTLFTTCKPFVGEAARLQRDALRSWALLGPRCRVLVIGDEPGVAEVCRELGLEHEPAVARTEAGAPRLDALFARAERRARTAFLAYANADLVLLPDWLEAAERVAAAFERFVMLARRVNLARPLAVAPGTPGWERKARAQAASEGRLEPPYGGIDLFVFPCGVWGELPPLAVGRGRWDSVLVHRARSGGLAVVDATARVTALHGPHAASRDAPGRAGARVRADTLRNEALLGGPEFYFTALNATHRLGPDGLRRQRVRRPDLWLRRAATWPAEHDWLAPLAPAVRAARPLWRAGRALAAGLAAHRTGRGRGARSPAS